MPLLTFQQAPADLLVQAIGLHGSALDASQTGTGKTYVACEVARRLAVPTLVICPKSVVPNWKRVATEMGTQLLDVLNPEALKTGSCEYLKRGPPTIYRRKDPKTGKIKETKVYRVWIWNIPKGSLVIFDEAHRFSAPDSQNAYILALTRAYGLRSLLLSATIAETPLKMRALGYLLGLHHFGDFWSWCLDNGCYRNRWKGVDFTDNPAKRHKVMGKIHGQIFGAAKGVRLRIEYLPDFPENEVIADAIDLGDALTTEIENAYANVSEEIRKKEEANPLTEMLRARQVSELAKVAFLVEATRDLLDESCSVVVFFGFVESIARFIHTFGSNREVVRIQGGQPEHTRQASIEAFQSDRARIALCTIQAGGVGLSLHDLRGQYPRRSLICPTFSSTDLVQTLGRIHRAGGRSKAVQRIIFASGTVEEDACRIVRRKIASLDVLNDGDLQEGIKWS